MPLTQEEKRERQRISDKKYYEKNKEKRKEYLENNKEKIAIKHKEYRQTPNGKKSRIIAVWKQIGLICEDYDSLYCHYSLATECENCGVDFGERGDGSNTFKCMDHSHTTGEFRNFLCHKCNLLRGK